MTSLGTNKGHAQRAVRLPLIQRGVPRVDEIAASLEPGPANILTLRLAAADPEAHDARGAHLDRGDADLSVTLGEVRIAGREQRALDRHGQQELAAFRQMLHVEVTAVLAWRQRPQSVRRRRARRWHRVDAVGRQRKPAALRQLRLAPRPGLDLLA